jgi:hypothetical protein
VRDFRPFYVRSGSNSVIASMSAARPLSTESGNPPAVLLCRTSATTGLMLRNKEHHSKISSARPDSGNGIVTPSAWAVFMLMYSSTLVTCWTGRSPGFFALEYASGINARLTVRLRKTACVTHQTAGDSEVARLVDRGNRVADS